MPTPSGWNPPYHWEDDDGYDFHDPTRWRENKAVTREFKKAQRAEQLKNLERLAEELYAQQRRVLWLGRACIAIVIAGVISGAVLLTVNAFKGEGAWVGWWAVVTALALLASFKIVRVHRRDVAEFRAVRAKSEAGLADLRKLHKAWDDMNSV